MIRWILAMALALAVHNASLPAQAAPNPARPNVVIFLADDMGFSDLGCYGGEIATPNIDSLAKNGLRFTQFYNTARCWPTRGALLTGYYAQQIRRDTVPGITSGSAGVRPAWAKLLPDRLKAYGYRSYHSGKWHVDGKPTANGFDQSYWLEDCGRYFGPRTHFLNDRKLPPVSRDSGYYSTLEIATRAVDFLKDHQANYPQEPFFAYICFTAPHFPLQAFPEDIAKYQARYRSGWQAIRDQRWQRIKQLGISSSRLPGLDREIGPPYHFPRDLLLLGPGETNRPVHWAELTSAQQEFQARKMAIHAAMIDRMDREIGRVLTQLRAMNALENTLILFLSDNGASAEMMVRDDGHDPDAAGGSARSHLCLGPGWSSAANTPLRLHKTWVHEGGISTPLIVHWPKGIKANGKLRRRPGHVIDLAPTILELAGGAPVQGPAPSGPKFPGRSLVPAIRSGAEVPSAHLWWSHEGNRAIRVGDWKLVGRRGAAWELYDLKHDRGEQRDLAPWQPEKVRELERLWEARDAEFTAAATGAPPRTSAEK